MTFSECPIHGAYHVEITPVEDERGLFARAWCRDEFAAHGLTDVFVQANLAQSGRAGTLRGIHYQHPPHAEAKFVRCLRGAVYDVVVDLRPESPTYLQWHVERLTAERRNALYVPAGCGHGYQTLVDDTELFYLVTAAYAPEAEGGIRYDDPRLAIDWPREVTVVSDKDTAWPALPGEGTSPSRSPASRRSCP
jgi:dTDP-4-dehydrorhamnose 3,5-epimerase